ncbi:hypothetical protein EVA_03675 [gut metagenome]|uniref:Uncharacterized protein n=1 Tax=gut metagenome TaxID=749906 RepID=J9GKA8_9ZZZZ
MAVNSKQKGARFERQLAGLFRDYGYTEARRTAQYCGNTGDASDVVGLPGIHVEAKHQERMQLYDWMDQAKRDAKAGGAGLLPAVFSKKNNHSILVTMELDDWMQIYREYQSGMVQKDERTQFNPTHRSCNRQPLHQMRRDYPRGANDLHKLRKRGVRKLTSQMKT